MGMDNNFPTLNLPHCKLRVKSEGEHLSVWDALRGRWLVLTPEEWVRQNFIGFIVSSLGVPAQYIMQECRADLGGPARADIVVFSREGSACMLVECKAPDVELDNNVLAQAVRYNSIYSAPYIVITNGLRHLCFSADGARCAPMGGFPDLLPYFRA